MMLFRLSRASMQSPDWFSIVNPTPSAKEEERIYVNWDSQRGVPGMESPCHGIAWYNISPKRCFPFHSFSNIAFFIP